MHLQCRWESWRQQGSQRKLVVNGERWKWNFNDSPRWFLNAHGFWLRLEKKWVAWAWKLSFVDLVRLTHLVEPSCMQLESYCSFLSPSELYADFADFSFLTFPISMFPRMAYTEFTTTGMLHCLQSCPDWYSRTIPRIIPMDDAMVLNKFEVWSHVFKHYPESCLQNIFLTPVFSETFCRYCAASAGNPLPQHGWLMNKNTRFDGFESSSFSSWDFTLLNSKT